MRIVEGPFFADMRRFIEGCRGLTSMQRGARIVVGVQIGVQGTLWPMAWVQNCQMYGCTVVEVCWPIGANEQTGIRYKRGTDAAGHCLGPEGDGGHLGSWQTPANPAPTHSHRETFPEEKGNSFQGPGLGGRFQAHNNLGGLRPNPHHLRGWRFLKTRLVHSVILALVRNQGSRLGNTITRRKYRPMNTAAAYPLRQLSGATTTFLCI